MKILDEKVVPSAVAMKLLEERSKRGELQYEQKNALEHLKKFVKLDLEKVKKLEEELKKIRALRDKHIAALIDFLPQDKEELRVVLHKDMNLLKQDEVEKVLQILKSV